MEFENESKEKAKKMAKIIIAIIIIVGIAIILFTIILPNIKSSDSKKNEEEKAVVEIPDNAVTDSFTLCSYSKRGKKVEYGAYIIANNDEDDMSIEYKTLTFNANDFNLRDNLLDYNSDIEVRLTYSPDDYKVYNCVVIDAMTGEELTDLSKENLEKLYNIEYGKQIIEKEWTDEIKLSELKENELYKYSAPKKSTEYESNMVPDIINDIGKNCIVYTKTSDDEDEDDFFNDRKDGYDKEIYVANSIGGRSFSFCESDLLYILYKKIDNETTLKLIEDNKILALEGYNSGDELDYSFEEYIYNNNNFPVQITITDNNVSGEKITKSYWMDANEIWGFSWMIDSAIIEY